MSSLHVKQREQVTIVSRDLLKQCKENGLEGAIVGKAIYENRVTLKELSEINA